MSHSRSLNYLYFSPYQISPQSHTILSLGPHWFLIRILTSILNLTTFGNSINISFSSSNMVSNGWFKMYLNPNQQSFLKNSGKFELYPIINQRKISFLKSLSNQDCYVYASDDWEPPPNAHIAFRITNTLYLVKNLTINDDIKYDSRILSIKPVSHKKPNNRYNSGFLQTHQQRSIYDHGIYAPIRSLHNIGLNGTGQVINIVDTGIDVTNAMFYDPENPLDSISGKTNKKHRKIIRIEKYADDLDYESGHGTHVSGTVAGLAYCTDDHCGISQYNGIASGAKIYFSDIGHAEIPGDMSEEIDLAEQAKILKELDSFISSNSWGYDYPRSDEIFNYDQSAYNNPNILYIFAAGNDYVYFSINSPSCAKNILSIGATTSVSSSIAESSTLSVVVENETVSFECTERSNMLIRSLSISEKMTYIVNRSVVSYDTSNASKTVKNSIVLLNSSSSEMCNLYSNVVSEGASAVIYPSSANLSCASFSIPTIEASDVQFEKISEMKSCSIFPYSGSDDSGLPPIAPLSSKGPAESGLSKPEIVLPGKDVISAKSHGTSSDFNVSSDFDSSLLQMSGTSMATPAAAALAAIARQYFREGFYPSLKKNSSHSITPSSSLLRAILVNSAVKPNRTYIDDIDDGETGPSMDVGFGIPCLETVLGFKSSGLRIVDNVEIKSNSHHIYRITLDSNLNDFRVTMAYLDPPLSPENDAILFADLDLVVKGPNGKTYIGNGVENLADSDSFTNTERVIVGKDEIPTKGGQYEVHVISNHYPIDSQKVMYSIVANGPFKQTNSLENPIFLKHRDASETDCVNNCMGNGKCNKKGLCECNENSIGLFCNTRVTTLFEGDINNETYVHKNIHYFKLSPKVPTSNLTFVDFHINTYSFIASLFLCVSTERNPGKMTNAAWQCFRATKEDYSFELSKNNDFKSLFLAAYISFFNGADVVLSNISFNCNERPISPNSTNQNNKKSLIIIIVCVVCVIFIALLAGLIVFLVKRNKEKKANNDDIHQKIILDSDSNSTAV